MKKFLLLFCLLFAGCTPEAPEPCRDYAYKISRIPGNRKVASCPHGMKMTIENSLVQGTMVYCKCP